MREKPPNIKIAFLDVGQGDTSVISCPDTQEAIVVDCINADAVIDYLEQEQIKHLCGIVITHLHADHYDEVDYLINRCNLIPGIGECERLGFNQIIDKRSYDKLIQDYDEHSSKYDKASRETTLRNILRWCDEDASRYIGPEVEIQPLPLKFTGELAKSVRLIHPYKLDIPNLEQSGLNSTSVVLRISGPGSSALLTGDLEPRGWQQLKKRYPNYSTFQSDILKFPHHGGAWKNMADVEDLLDKVNPSIVVISVGSDNSYSHPHPDVFTALHKREGIRVLCTQATNQCCVLNESVRDKRDDIVNKLRSQAGKSGHELIGSKRGCPCAGTIVIELGDKAQVIQPQSKLHTDAIITPFFKRHKCNLLKVEQNTIVQQSVIERM